MSLILNIDTSVQTASIALARDGSTIDFAVNPSPRDHASWLQPAIRQLIAEQGISLNQLDAIAVTSGPGSYTGLRVGMATAKGLCYALKKQLITIGTLQMMASAATETANTELLCPMIDARRMEVFTAVYDRSLNELKAPHSCILTEESFDDLMNGNTISFFGNGSEKFRTLTNHPSASFKHIDVTAAQMTSISYQKLRSEDFVDLAYSEPFYGKQFYSPPAKHGTNI
jgi:tRNA threonylcarbamoyladenosine biosynthesis protein TsaB